MSEDSEGLARIVFSYGEDCEILRDQIRRFNEHNRGTIDFDVISGGVIWPAQFACSRKTSQGY